MTELRDCIAAEAQALSASLSSATEAATHSENKAENKYDTRGLEASYLAGAQGERLLLLQNSLLRLQQLSLRRFTLDDTVALTAIVCLRLEDSEALYWLLPVAGGYTLAGAKEGAVQTLTPETPLGRALLGKAVGDAIVTCAGKWQREYELIMLA